MQEKDKIWQVIAFKGSHIPKAVVTKFWQLHLLCGKLSVATKPVKECKQTPYSLSARQQFSSNCF
jgi:hypothetical protein